MSIAIFDLFMEYANREKNTPKTLYCLFTTWRQFICSDKEIEIKINKKAQFYQKAFQKNFYS